MDACTQVMPSSLLTYWTSSWRGAIHFLNAGQKLPGRRPAITFGKTLKDWDTRESSPLRIEWVAGSAAGSRTIVLLPRLEGNYRDKDRDSEGNTPGFQRSPYQDEGERWHGGCSVFYLCRVHFLSQRQSIPEQKTWLKKKSHADADEGSVIFFSGQFPAVPRLSNVFLPLSLISASSK